MDAQAYFDFMDAILTVQTSGALEAMRTRLDTTEMLPSERQMLERVLRSRAKALHDEEVVRERPRRAD